MWVLTTAKLLYPTAAGDTSLSPLVRGSRRRSWLQPALNTGQGIHLWCGNHGTRWASFLDNPVVLPSKQVSTPCTAVVPALGDKYHRWEPSLPLHAILGPCWVFAGLCGKHSHQALKWDRGVSQPRAAPIPMATLSASREKMPRKICSR